LTANARPNDMATMKDLAMAVRLTVDNRCIQMKRKPLDAEGGWPSGDCRYLPH
jgi:hypothetical protein